MGEKQECQHYEQTKQWKDKACIHTDNFLEKCLLPELRSKMLLISLCPASCSSGKAAATHCPANTATRVRALSKRSNVIVFSFSLANYMLSFFT